MKRIPWLMREELYRDVIGLDLFPKQRTFLMQVEDDLQFLILVGGIGASKSYSVALYVLPEIIYADAFRELNGWPLNGEHNAEKVVIWLVGSQFDNTRKEFDYIVNTINGNQHLLAWVGGWQTPPLRPRNSEWYAKTNNGVEIVTKSWMGVSADSIRSEAVHYLVVCEAGQLDEATYKSKLIERIGRTNGVMLLSGTLEYEYPLLEELFNWGQTGTPMAKSMAIATWDNIRRYPGGINDPAITMMRAAINDDNIFYERCGAKPRKVPNLVHPYFDRAVHWGPYPYDYRYPVQVFVDPGSNYYVGVGQVVEGTPRVIDEYFNGNMGTTESAIEWVCRRPYANQIASGVIDVRETDAKDIWERGAIWKHNNPSRLRGVKMSAQSVPIMAGIDRVNSFLLSKKYNPIADAGRVQKIAGVEGVPRLYFDHRIERLTWELEKGYKFQTETDGSTRRRTPVDKHNHGSKALAYWLVDQFGKSELLRGNRKPRDLGDPYAHLRRSVSEKVGLT